jgi:hypothetical protein
LAERYAMTGIITIDGEEQIFLFDRTDQSRDLITKKPNSKNISLVSLVREGVSSPIKASIRVGGETGTVGFIESAQSKGVPAPPAAPGSMAAGIGAAGLHPLGALSADPSSPHLRPNPPHHDPRKNLHASQSKVSNPAIGLGSCFFTDRLRPAQRSGTHCFNE